MTVALGKLRSSSLSHEVHLVANSKSPAPTDFINIIFKVAVDV